jgi:hypothetical protein
MQATNKHFHQNATLQMNRAGASYLTSGSTTLSYITCLCSLVPVIITDVLCHVLLSNWTGNFIRRKDLFKKMWQDMMNTNEAIQHWPEQFQSQAPRWAAVYGLQEKCEWKGSLMDVIQTIARTVLEDICDKPIRIQPFCAVARLHGV